MTAYQESRQAPIVFSQVVHVVVSLTGLRSVGGCAESSTGGSPSRISACGCASPSNLRLRILLLVAVKNDLALVAAGAGPFWEFGPDSGPGLPSGANVLIAQDMGKYVNSFRWKGDPLD